MKHQGKEMTAASSIIRNLYKIWYGHRTHYVVHSSNLHGSISICATCFAPISSYLQVLRLKLLEEEYDTIADNTLNGLLSSVRKLIPQ
jgi:uncharacterized UBP type Zn finger protein